MKKRISLSILLLAGLSGVAALAAAEAPKVDINALKKAYVRPKKIPYPPENPYTKDKEELGRALFYDPRVSGSNLISCASCHNPSFSWGDALPKGVGHGHKTLGRRTPTILNVAFNEGRTFWDGRATTLEDQALGPIESEGEMNMRLSGPEGLVEKLKTIKGYAPMFKKEFPKDEDPITTPNVAKAIATFERGVISGTAPFDRFVQGDNKAISEAAKRGFVTFNTKAACITCHSGWNFTDNSFHDIGIPGDDLGRGKFLTKLTSMQHAFKTPTLRNVDHRGPYMHDGSEKTLEDVIELYNLGGRVTPRRESVSALIRPLNLTKDEKSDLVAFLKTLTSVDKPQHLVVLPR